MFIYLFFESFLISAASRDASDTAAVEYKALDHNIVNNGYTRKKIASVKTLYRTTFTRYTTKNDEVLRYEEEHSIETRWLQTSKEYSDALVLMRERKYRRAIDQLERLVVQRLFEMTKLGMSGVGMRSLFNNPLCSCTAGYKMREKISKSLKTRAEAIHTALRNYNNAAAQLNPPREQLSWESVINAGSIADLDILRDTRQDIRSLIWAQPSHREGMVLYFGIKRAKEEILRLNVEIERLLTFLYDSHVDFYLAISRNIIPNPALAFELSEQWRYQDRISEDVVQRLVQTSHLDGFSGRLSIAGTRVGRDPTLSSGVVLPSWASLLKRGLQSTYVAKEVEDDGFPVLPDVGSFLDMLETGSL